MVTENEGKKEQCMKVKNKRKTAKAEAMAAFLTSWMKKQKQNEKEAWEEEASMLS